MFVVMVVDEEEILSLCTTSIGQEGLTVAEFVVELVIVVVVVVVVLVAILLVMAFMMTTSEVEERLAVLFMQCVVDDES